MTRERGRHLYYIALLVAGGVALSADLAMAQSQMQSTFPTLMPQAAPLSQTSPAAPAATTSPPAAQATSAGPSDAVRAAYDAAFQQTLEKPSDPTVLVRFAEKAVEVGDVEGAISALERLLLIDGEQPDVKLELGVLYYRLGSVEAARTYLDDVSTSSLASDEAKARANTFLKAMKKP